MVETVKTISTTEIPDWLKKYQDEILTRAQALGKDEGFVLPQYQVAGRTPLQGQASQLAASGVGSYFPMLQAGAGTVGQGVGGLQQAQQAMMQGYAPLDAATQMTGNAVMGAQPYQQVAYDAMGQAIPTTMAAAQAGQEMAALGRQDLGTAAGQVLGAGSRGELAAAGGVQGILGAAMQGDAAAQQAAQNILAQTYPGQVSLGQGAMDVQQAAQTGQAYGSLGASGLGDLASRSAQLGSAALASLPEYGQRMEAQGLQSAADIQRAAGSGIGSTMQAQRLLSGTTGQYDPSSTAAFMNPYEDAAVQQALQDIARQGQIAQQGVAAQAVGSGAFGGSRQGVAQQELARNVLQQQGQTAAQMRNAGYQTASQAAQAAYEASMGRGQNAAQLGAGIGQAQAGQLMQGAQAAGQAAQQGTQAGAATAQAAT